MAKINYDGRVFKGVENYHDGDLNPDTRFHYHQKGDVVWGEVIGGDVACGSLLAAVREDGSLDMSWHYVNTKGKLIRGLCHSIPEVLSDGRLRLLEEWLIDGGEAGRSAIEEISRD